MPWNPDLFQRASRFAAEAHAGQCVPGTDLPYLLHLMQVAAEVMGALASEPERGADADLALVCALLHDTLEDTPTSRETIAERFGERAADGVAALTKDDSLPKGERMADSLRRILAQPKEVALVKLADRIVNLQRPPAHWSEAKIAAYKDEARTILDALGDASPHLATRFREKMAAYPPER